MVQSIELVFAEQDEEQLRRQWADLAAAGLPSLAEHRSDSNRPHVTLAVASAGLDVAVDALTAVMRGWGLPGRGMAASIGAPVLFGGHRGRWVLARQVVPSLALLTLHSDVHQAVAAVGVDASELTLPDRWTPHVTLAQRMPTDRLSDALGVLAMETLPVRFVAARLWDSASKSVTALR